MTKKQNRTSEEIMKDMQNKAEIARKRNIIVDKFYPALIDATISIDEAKMLISAIGNIMMEEVLKTMKVTKLSEIKEALIKVLCQDGERKEEITKLLNTLEDENLYVSREIIEGMTRSIDTMISDEMKDRKLDTLKTKWETYLN